MLSGMMNPAETFRLSVTKRLEAAAKEIFLLFHRSVAQYEEEIERQRRLLDVVWKPHVKLHRIDFHQPYVYDEEEEQQEEEEHFEEVEEKEQDELLKETQEEVVDFGEQQRWDHRNQGRNHEVKQEPLVMQEELQKVKQEVEEEYDAQLKKLDDEKHDEQLEEEEEDEAVVGEQKLWDHRDQGRNHEVKQEPLVMQGELQKVKQEAEEEYDAQLKDMGGEKPHEQLEEEREDEAVVGEQQLWDHRDQGRNHEVISEAPVTQELQQVKQEVEVYDAVDGAKQLNQLEEEEAMDALVEQQLWDDWNEWMNPEVKPEPPAVEELQEVKPESDDIPVSCSREGSEDKPKLWNADGRVDTLAEVAPAAEGHQQPAGPSDQTAGLKGLHLGTTAGDASLQIPKQLRPKAPGPTSQEKTHICTVCSAAFSSEIVLAYHRREVHADELPFKCHPCGKGFRSYGYLRNHSRIHRLTKCSHPGCGKVFLKNSFLKRHMMVHSKEKPHQCNTCERRFKKSDYLKVHMRTHTGEKPFSCKICGKSVTTKVSLNTHMRIHTGEKPFSCKICGKSVTSKVNLNTHMRIHTGEKPYKCKICGRSFCQSHHLTAHHKRFHSGQAKTVQPSQRSEAQSEEKFF